MMSNENEQKLDLLQQWQRAHETLPANIGNIVTHRGTQF